MAWREDVAFGNLKCNKLTVAGLLNAAVNTTGSVFYVHSGTGADGTGVAGKTPSKPFATIDYAVGRCTASKGDVIIVMPGHAETITTASDIDIDVAGVSVIGLGQGKLRPTITLGAAAATIEIGAANCTLENVILTANFADITKAIEVTADDALIKNVSFLETALNMNFLTCIATSAVDNGADGLSVIGCERISIDAAALAFISILGNCSRLKVIGNFDNQASAADVGHFIIMAAKVCLGAMITDNVLNLTGDNNAQTVGIFMTGSSASSTGIVARNLVNSLDTTTELMVTATLDFGLFENYYTGTINASGKLWPVVDGA